MIYGYASINKQGQDLEKQTQSLMSKGVEIENLVVETYTGPVYPKPKYANLTKSLKEGDVLVVSRVNKLGRNPKEAVKEIDKLIKRGVSVHLLDFGLIDNSPEGLNKFQSLIQVFASLAKQQMAMRKPQAG